MTLFARSEYEDRVQETKARMDDEGIDALLATDPANMLYLTGYNGWSFYVPQTVVVFPDRDEPVWIGREMDANAAAMTTWLDEESIHPYPEEYVKTVLDKHPADFMADVIREYGYEGTTLGAGMGAYYFTARDYKRLKSNLPDATFVDTTNLVNAIRCVKGEREIEYMRMAATITDSMMETAIDAIGPGVRQNDVVAEILHAMARGTDEFGGDYSNNPPLMPTGRGTNTPHLTWTDEELSEEEPVILELGGCKHRHHAPLARTVYIGDPPASLRELHEVANAGLKAALDTVKPGIACEDVAFAYQDTIAKYGFEKESRLGYRAGGGEFPPSWGEGNWERIPSPQPGDTTELEPNMTFHLIAGMWEDEYGVELSETIRVTDDGAETFSELPRELFTT